MTPQSDHIVRKLTLDLDLRCEQAHAYALQHSLKERVKGSVLAQMEQIFGQYAEADEYIRISRLELDLGNLIQEQLPWSFEKKFIAAIEQELSKLQIPQIGAIQDQELLEERRTSAGSDRQNQSRKRKRQHRKSYRMPLEIAVWEQFFFFLQEGRLPIEAYSWEEWEELLVEKVLEKNGKRFIEALKKHVQVQPRVIDRLLTQFSDVFLIALATQVRMSKGEKNEPSQKVEDRSGVEQILIETFLPKTNRTRKETESVDVHHSSPDRTDNQEKAQDLPHRQVDNPEAASLAELRAKESEERGLYLANAGLALIIPCIQPLFRKLGYLAEDGQFVSSEWQARAAHLLQFIATGKQHTAEHELLLNKIMCGIPLRDLIPRWIDLTDTEKQEAELFVTAIISHLPKLKNTTVDGLRHNFLIREGKLQAKANFWNLTVQQSSIDPFLLNPLPWSISLVKYKWMPKRLQVQWL